jgi:hypothetical protein
VTGETNLTQCLERVVDECKMSFKELVAAKGLPQEGCYGFITTPDPNDYRRCVGESATQSPAAGDHSTGIHFPLSHV